MSEENVKEPLLPPALPKWWRGLPALILIMIITTIDSLILNDFIEYRYRNEYQANSTSKSTPRELCLNDSRTSYNESKLVLTTTSIYPKSTTETWDTLIQQSTARLNVLTSLGATIPSILTAILLGANCDRIGRKPLIVLPYIGKLIRYCILMIVALYNLSDIWIILSVTFDGVFGTASLAILSVFAYVTDCTDKKTRTGGIIITDVCINCSRFIPLLTIGIYLEKPHFIQSMAFTFALSLVGFILCVCFQPESNLNVQHMNIFQQLKQTEIRQVTKIFSVFFAQRQQHKQRSLLLLVSIHLCIIVMLCGNYAMYYLYLYGAPFCMDSFGVSLNNVAQTAATIFFTIPFTLTIAKRSDHLIWPMIGCLAFMIQLTLFGITKEIWILYLAVCIGSLFSVLIPIIRSRITKLVEPHEYAAVFILASIFESGGYYAISALANEIYQLSVIFFQGLVFFVFVFVGFIATILMLILCILEYEPSKKAMAITLND